MKKSHLMAGGGNEAKDFVAPTRLERIRSLVRWNEDGGSFRVHCEEAVGAVIGLRLRRPTVLRTIGSCCDEIGPWRWIDRRANVEVLGGFTAERLERYLQRMIADLARIAYEPLTPKLLLQALPITNRERLRWMKDNRLPKNGTIVVRRGQAVAVPTYAAETVEHLMENPDIIEEWRKMDRTRGGGDGVNAL
jgi:hypothetical protein